jgi:hypothetical protein
MAPSAILRMPYIDRRYSSLDSPFPLRGTAAPTSWMTFLLRHTISATITQPSVFSTQHPVIYTDTSLDLISSLQTLPATPMYNTFFSFCIRLFRRLLLAHNRSVGLFPLHYIPWHLHQYQRKHGIPFPGATGGLKQLFDGAWGPLFSLRSLGAGMCFDSLSCCFVADFVVISPSNSVVALVQVGELDGVCVCGRINCMMVGSFFGCFICMEWQWRWEWRLRRMNQDCVQIQRRCHDMSECFLLLVLFPFLSSQRCLVVVDWYLLLCSSTTVTTLSPLLPVYSSMPR